MLSDEISCAVYATANLIQRFGVAAVSQASSTNTLDTRLIVTL